MTDPIGHLWRAAQVFRLVTLVYAIGQQLASVQNYTRPQLSWVLVGVMVMWTGVAAALLGGNSVPRGWVVVGDQLIAGLLIIGTRFVADHDWYHNHQTFPTNLWVTNAVFSAALQWGLTGALASAVGLAALSAVARELIDLDLWRDATAPQLIAAGAAVAVAAGTGRRAHDQLERAIRLTAATEERERLAREVHDGVLQVLAYVRRRAGEIGGPAVELADKAGEQEIALRMLISEQNSATDSGGEAVDLRPLLRTQERAGVTVAAPGVPVPLDRRVATEIAAAVAAALANVAQHAGPGARAYVLLESLDSEVLVSVRDDGVGIPPERLHDAETEGRMGVSKSIRGRIAALGGSAALVSAPGEGTEWEFRVPRDGVRQ
ncbi:MacS family sensor histidine kinase [Skermania piniformis]|uniref:MacS family sensor histidine kinase n=1 Tax=Skermania pinensis TaxID=39122 RepID=UPI000A4285BE|nr:DUF5931 domain-containing protein [Skermania piniformis]